MSKIQEQRMRALEIENGNLNKHIAELERKLYVFYISALKAAIAAGHTDAILKQLDPADRQWVQNEINRIQKVSQVYAS